MFAKHLIRPLHLVMGDPLLPVGWRWAQAGSILVAGKRPTKRIADLPIRQAIAYRRGLARCHCDADHVRLARRWPHLHQARDLAEQDGPRLWELQARLLARQDDNEIATRMGLVPASVNTFEQVFFAVRARFRAWVWILLDAIGAEPGGVYEPGDLGTLWRAFGYFTGPFMLDVVIEATSPNRRQRADPHLRQLVERAVAAMSMPVDQLPRLVAAARRYHQAAGGNTKDLEWLELMAQSAVLSRHRDTTPTQQAQPGKEQVAEDSKKPIQVDGLVPV